VTTLLIDGDEYLYKACAALETEVQWDEQNHVLACNAEEAWDVFVGSIEKIKGALDAKTGYLAFTGKGNFRQTIYPPYKNHRPKRKPMCYGLLRERAQQHFKCHSVDGLEADDVLGIWATSGKFGDTVIVSSDKDMQTLPTKIYREGEVLDVSEADADIFWLFQTLTGDTADGYPGCPGIGKVKADRLLEQFTGGNFFMFNAAWEAIVRTYEAAGLTYDDALTQARLARILRVEDWDNEKKEVKLWKP
jgi:DNA polymerase I